VAVAILIVALFLTTSFSFSGAHRWASSHTGPLGKMEKLGILQRAQARWHEWRDQREQNRMRREVEERRLAGRKPVAPQIVGKPETAEAPKTIHLEDLSDVFKNRKAAEEKEEEEKALQAKLEAEKKAKLAAEHGDAQQAGELYSALLQEEPENAEAWGGLIRARMTLGNEDQARAALEQVPAKIADHPEVAGARSALALAEEGRKARDQLDVFKSRLAADPADHQARYDLATALNGMGQREEAADALLEVIRRNRSWNDEAARLQLLKFFESWGFDDPVTMAARRRLSTVLFS